MVVSLSRRTQKLVERRIAQGRYESPDEVVQAALVVLEQQESLGDFAPGKLTRLLAEGERSIKRHGTLDGERALRMRRQRRAIRQNAKP